MAYSIDLLTQVKSALGISGEYQDATLTVYVNDVKGVLADAGVPQNVIESDRAVGCISRGVIDMWTLGSGQAKFSNIFYQRMLQLKVQSSTTDESGDVNG